MPHKTKKQKLQTVERTTQIAVTEEKEIGQKKNYFVEDIRRSGVLIIGIFILEIGLYFAFR